LVSLGWIAADIACVEANEYVKTNAPLIIGAIIGGVVIGLGVAITLTVWLMKKRKQDAQIFNATKASESAQRLRQASSQSVHQNVKENIMKEEVDVDYEKQSKRRNGRK
jgi:mannitol-specific phosphotransferase system IIBC component